MLKDTLNTSWKLYKSNFIAVIAVSLISQMQTLMLSNGLRASAAFVFADGAASDMVVSSIGMIFFIFSGALSIGIINFFICLCRDKKVEFKNVFVFFTSWKRFFTATWLSILPCIFIILSLLIYIPTLMALLMISLLLSIAFVTWMLILAIHCVFSYYILCRDKTLGAFQCVKLAFRFMHNRLLKTIGSFGVVLILPLCFYFFVTPMLLSVMPTIVCTIVVFIFNVAYMAFSSIVFAVYFDGIIPTLFGTIGYIDSINSDTMEEQTAEDNIQAAQAYEAQTTEMESPEAQTTETDNPEAKN